MKKNDVVSEFNKHQRTNLKTADLVIDGALVETKLFIYGKVSHFFGAEYVYGELFCRDYLQILFFFEKKHIYISLRIISKFSYMGMDI